MRKLAKCVLAGIVVAVVLSFILPNSIASVLGLLTAAVLGGRSK